MEVDLKFKGTPEELQKILGSYYNSPQPPPFRDQLDDNPGEGAGEEMKFTTAKDIMGEPMHQGTRVRLSESESIPRNTDKIHFDQSIAGEKGRIAAIYAPNEAEVVFDKIKGSHAVKIRVHTHWLERIEDEQPEPKKD